MTPGDLDVRAFVQARMSSTRFPGKVLAPFRGRPLVRWVVDAVAQAVGDDQVVVVTSDTPTDEPLAAYLSGVGIACFQGPLDDVLGRFRLCAAVWPADWILRICADSPLLDPEELRSVLAAADPTSDLVTTRLTTGSPHGRNAELIRTATLLGLDDAELTPHDREHVTPFFYRLRERFGIVEVPLGHGRYGDEPLTVDTIDDLRRLEALP